MTRSSTDGGPSVGLMLPTAADADDRSVDAARVMNTAQLAEAAGFDGVYVGDHLVHPRPLLESVVTLATVAASTAHVALGFCVLPSRAPDRAARQGAGHARRVRTGTPADRCRRGRGVPAGVRDRGRSPRGAGPPDRRRGSRAAVAPGGPADHHRRSRRSRDRGDDRPTGAGNRSGGVRGLERAGAPTRRAARRRLDRLPPRA